MNYIDRATSVIENEMEGLANIKEGLDESFVKLVELCLETLKNGGKLLLSGVGKSGYIGHKIAATLTSTGAPAVFLHPVEAMHGDLGMVNEKDLLIALSYSGETTEILEVVPSAKRFGIPVIAITGDPESQLAKWSDLVVLAKVHGEACPFNLAPTTSTTAMMALGDALAMVLLDAQGFGAEDYGKIHPAGSIGRSVSLKVADVMRRDERLPIVAPETAVKEALFTMSRCRSGSVIIADKEERLLGIFTDGDFRRHAQDDLNILNTPIKDVMTPDPASINEQQMAVEILNLFEGREIDDIPVVNDTGQIVGLVDIQDLPKFKLM